MKGDVLLTGATGLIGGEIAVRLMKTGRRVWCLVRSKSFAEAAARLECRFALSGEQCDWGKVIALPGDVTEDFLGLAEETLDYLRHQCTQIIHCAADTSFAARNCCRPVNVAGTRNVLDLCELFGPHVRLFFMSSAVVCLEPENLIPRSSRGNEAHSSCLSTINHQPSTGISEPPYVGCYESRGALIQEDMPCRGFANDYVLSKRRCEEIVLQSWVDSVILRPSIVLSHGVQSSEFARAVLWVLPVIRRLEVLPLSGDERIDAVSVRFVAHAVAEMLERPLPHRIYHVSAGVEASVTWKELFAVLSESGHDYSAVNLDPELDWAGCGRTEARLPRLKEMLRHYLPFMRAGAVYDCSRLRQALGEDLPPCPKATDYCAELLDLVTEHEAFEEALNP